MTAIDHPLIDRFLEALWLEKGLSENTRMAYRSDLAHFNAWLVEREVELPDYRQFLVGGGRRVPLPDPMQQVASAYLARLASGATTNTENLLAAHRNLCQLAAAAGV